MLRGHQAIIRVTGRTAGVAQARSPKDPETQRAETVVKAGAGLDTTTDPAGGYQRAVSSAAFKQSYELQNA